MLDHEDSDLPVRLTEEEALTGEIHYIEDMFGPVTEQEKAIEQATNGRCPIRDVEKALKKALSRG
jgi:hypothetical protein